MVVGQHLVQIRKVFRWKGRLFVIRPLMWYWREMNPSTSTDITKYIVRCSEKGPQSGEHYE